MAKQKPPQEETVRDGLASELQILLNKDSRDGQIAYFLDENDDPSTITDWLSTGNDLLDLSISNRPNAGIPVGRIIEVTGQEAAGKSLLAAHLLANTQKKGGVAVYIDTESAASPEFMKAIGIDVKNLIYISVETIEEVFENIERIVEKVRKATKDRLVTIVVDSVAGASTKTEQEANYDKDGYATAKAIIMSKSLRKVTTMIGKQRIALIFTNQLREKLNAMAFADKWTVPGGKALPFHASVRLRLTGVGKIKLPNGDVCGITTSCNVVKNRMGPPFRTTQFDILYDRGIDNYGSWFEFCKNKEIIAISKKDKEKEKEEADKAAKDAPIVKKSKEVLAMEKKAAKANQDKSRTFGFVRENGEEVKFQKKDWVGLLTNEDQTLRNEIYKRICDAYILMYRDQDAPLVEVEHDEDDATGMNE